MLYRLRQRDGRDNLFGNWIEPDGRSSEVAAADNSIAPTGFTDIGGRKVPTAWRVAIPARGLKIETTPLNPRSWMGTSFPYWEGTDQLCRQPRRHRLPGIDGVLGAPHEEEIPMLHYTAIVTCLAVAFYFFTSTQVARARVRLGVKLPAITGNPEFERIFRVQMNTLEWMPIFLPSLWLFAIYLSDRPRPRRPRRWKNGSARPGRCGSSGGPDRTTTPMRRSGNCHPPSSAFPPAARPRP